MAWNAADNPPRHVPVHIFRSYFKCYKIINKWAKIKLEIKNRTRHHLGPLVLLRTAAMAVIVHLGRIFATTQMSWSSWMLKNWLMIYYISTKRATTTTTTTRYLLPCGPCFNRCQSVSSVCEGLGTKEILATPCLSVPHQTNLFSSLSPYYYSSFPHFLQRLACVNSSLHDNPRGIWAWVSSIGRDRLTFFLFLFMYK